MSPLGFVANSGHEGRGYTDTEKIDSLGSGNPDPSAAPGSPSISSCFFACSVVAAALVAAVASGDKPRGYAELFVVRSYFP